MRTSLYCTTIFLLFTFFSFAANTTYTIKQGDTLYDIARRHNTSVWKIEQANDLQSNNLKIGSSLTIPSNIVSYKIKSGDTLGSVAQKFGLSSSKEIMELNGFNSSFVKIGQTIRIPSSASKSQTTSKTTTDIVVKITVTKAITIVDTKGDRTTALNRNSPYQAAWAQAPYHLRREPCNHPIKLTKPSLSSEVELALQVAENLVNSWT